MDRIRIRNLEIFGYHGVYEEENVLGQKFLIDADIFLDTRKAGLSDKLKDSVSYGDIIRIFKEEMNSQSDKLLERVAERLARSILLRFEMIDSVEITVKKPWAPVMIHMDYAAVTIRRGWHRVFVGVGSNMGDRQGWLDLARERILSGEEIRHFRQASIFETEPYGYTDQDPFLNTVYQFETLLSPGELLDHLHEIENEAGRTRQIHWGPRTLDLDILLYDKLVTEEEDLVIPHPEMTKRLFVLEPLCELFPYGLHPLTGERFCDIMDNLKHYER